MSCLHASLCQVRAFYVLSMHTIVLVQDIVPTVPKWKCTWLFVRFSLFKRSGLRVHLSEEELIAIRPSLMEARLGIVFNCETPLPDSTALHAHVVLTYNNGAVGIDLVSEAMTM